MSDGTPHPNTDWETIQETRDKVLLALERETGVSATSVLSFSKLEQVTRVRAVAYVILRDDFGFTLQSIGDVFKRMNHTSVLAPYKRAKKRLESEPYTQELIRRVRNRLAGQADPESPIHRVIWAWWSELSPLMRVKLSEGIMGDLERRLRHVLDDQS